jgi:hypothetical protein
VASYSQAQLARKTGYARSTVSTVESGGQNAPRVFWERCDEVLGTGTAFAARHDQLAQQVAACSQTATLGRAGVTASGGRADRGLNAGTVSHAVSAYRELGWQAETAGGQVELVCGAGVEALEVPRAAGVVAVRWWLHTGGRPDEIRGLPGLPGPQDALAVIATSDRFFFLVQAGACPWTSRDMLSAPLAGECVGVRVRWHCGGKRILAPPSKDTEGQRVEWGYPPPNRVRLADPVVLLDLLARAVALTGPRTHVLTLPGGIAVMPAVDLSG